jgi:hypothetical protein
MSSVRTSYDRIDFQTEELTKSRERFARKSGHFQLGIQFISYSPLLGPDLFFSSVIFYTEREGLLGRVISPSQGRYLHTGQYKHRINALSGIRIDDPRVRASEDSSCLRSRGHCDWQRYNYLMKICSWKIMLLYVSLKP